MSQKTVFVYHKADFDGIGTAAIARAAHPEFIFVGYDYGHPVPQELDSADEVCFADVSMPIEQMIELGKQKKMTWLDHHITVVNDFKNWVAAHPEDNEITTIFDSKVATVEIAWKYYFPAKTMPKWVWALGVYDAWRREEVGETWWKNVILPFQYGMKTYCNSLEHFPVSLFQTSNENGDVDTESESQMRKIIATGEAAMMYANRVNEDLACQNAFTARIAGTDFNAICLNTAERGSSTISSQWKPDMHDVMLTFNYTGKFWRVSFYTVKPDIDCSKIAKLFNGGGHKGAAGCQTDDVWKIIVR